MRDNEYPGNSNKTDSHLSSARQSSFSDGLHIVPSLHLTGLKKLNLGFIGLLLMRKIHATT